MYRNCIFDLYGTLVDIHTDEEKQELWEKLALFYGYYGADYEADELQACYEKLVKQKTVEITKDSSIKRMSYQEMKLEEVFQELYTRKHVPVSLEHAVYTGQLFRIFSTEYIRLYEGTLQMLESLKESGKKLYLLSNAQRMFTEYEIRALGLEPYFEKIYLSSECGWQKPDRRFFDRLLTECGLSAEESVMIGNDGTCDVVGGAAAGLATVYIRSNISPKEPLPAADHVLEEMDMERLTEILLGK